MESQGFSLFGYFPPFSTPPASALLISEVRQRWSFRVLPHHVSKRHLPSSIDLRAVFAYAIQIGVTAKRSGVPPSWPTGHDLLNLIREVMVGEKMYLLLTPVRQSFAATIERILQHLEFSGQTAGAEHSHIGVPRISDSQFVERLFIPHFGPLPRR